MKEKRTLMRTCIILKIKAQLNQLVNWKLWVTLFYPEQWVEFWQNLHISQASQVLVWRRKKIRLKKFTETNFSNPVSYNFVIYLLKEVYRKIMSEIHFVCKTRYEDLTETGS